MIEVNKAPIYSSYFFSPFGLLKIIFEGDEISSIQFVRNTSSSKVKKSFSLFKNKIEENRKESEVYKKSLVRETLKQLKLYFEKRHKVFDLPLIKKGGHFDQKVRKALRKVPYGSTLSYFKLAKEAGYSKAFRAVGGACRRNPFLIVVPCHRVLKKDQTLGGFSVGLDLKRKLLRHEKAI